MATSLTDVGNSFGHPTSTLVNRSRNSSVQDNDDDVVFIESIHPPSTSSAIVDQKNFIFASSRNEKLQGNDSLIPSSRDLASQKGYISETIIIDDEEDIETNGGGKNSFSFIELGLPGTKNRTKDVDFSTSSLSRRKTKTAVGPFNPGRMNVAGNEFQKGGFATHHSPDSWISQSASFPRNQKQPGVDSLSPVGSLPKQICQSSAKQQLTKPAKITCAHCKKPLQKGQTAYQRKGSAHLFCSTTCLSSFSHKHTPKKHNVMCKKDVPAKRATVVPQVQSSQPFQEFCSTYRVSPYEDNQSLRKRISNKSRCTICNKLTEIRHEVSVNNVTHKLCSNHCFNKYRLTNGLIMNCCEHCGEYLPSKGSGSIVLVIDGQEVTFCCQSCANEYKQMLEAKSKKISISENRKRNAIREENEGKLYGSLNTLLKKIEGIPRKKEKTSEPQVSAECKIDASLTKPDMNLPASVSIIDDTFQEQLEDKKSEDSTQAVVLSADPGTWPRFLNIKQRDFLIENDPPQVRNFNFPKDNTGRKFSETYYTRILPNGEKTPRSWLLYSTSKDSVFCLHCKVFEGGKNQLKNENGCKDWQHLSHILSKHEESETHINNSFKYSKLKSDMKKNKTIETVEHREHENETNESVLLLYT
ncbi:zinc finger MYM-type protein 5 isoform X1 [Myotis daubentonii]|uniref:zinc finger MYM-type protein 5 isoform X1 n=1 Tax=Myotis daubentonii TaxID=98922 RepID=UPI00287335D6|nr:zinc finger MYM-type protein 5 isoform X1 [Myotis daubentonii]XP_059540117.1 zinc finger MYM-type protein 5 isoform X1 [Myotis daubentonii]XP_059540118.1 zinc finger MYM-type protein 5 isoform X1 [Myotis daubentonii]XP_059540119.1 zinc finger MYM-type protein 5 isoform X1 [Myotis daubentonii]XP_059540120.1 zinc finger MYM-type protein 5 isoform X1 [Myotis daubentonii]XP_059540121.1 zinc finger MYM-type protein 5 isoform X1 [Myotis daubentonii]XP_059540122.1 zinc finger MYM-type protein 5 i